MKLNTKELTILTIVIACWGIIFIVAGFIAKNNVKHVNKDKYTVSINKNNEEKDKETESPEEETPEDNTEETTNYIELDSTKSLNTNGYTYNSVTDKNQDIGLTLKITDDKQSVTVTINEKASKSIANIIHSTWSTESFDKSITGFNKNIKSTYIGGIGQDITGTILYFIMEDNTVQYAKLFTRKNNADGTKYYDTELYNEKLVIEEVPNIDGIVKLYGANANAPQSTGSYTTLAVKENNSFYDLSMIIS